MEILFRMTKTCMSRVLKIACKVIIIKSAELFLVTKKKQWFYVY